MHPASAPVPLSAVAEDARPLVDAFRAGGSQSFGCFSPEKSRELFTRACALNGLPADGSVDVEDIHVPVRQGGIRVRLYRGANLKPGSPLALFVHGGGWVIGDIDTHDGLCRFLAKGSGAVVASVDYRCSPEFPFPVPLEDCEDALSVLVSQASRWGIDPARTVLVGDSAGGNIATVIANGTLPDGCQVMAQVLLYPVTDLTASRPSHARVTEGFALVASSMQWFRDQYVPVGVPHDDPRLSPLLHAEGRLQPPMFIVTVGHDPLCDEGIEYANAAMRAGGQVVHHHLPDHMHGIFTAAGRIATARRVLGAAVRFIQDL